MPAKTRFIIVGVLILLGAGLFCYCAVFYPKDSVLQVTDAAPTLATAKPEPQSPGQTSSPVASRESDSSSPASSTSASSATASSDSSSAPPSRPRQRSGAT